jgi:hypothetical protein
MVGAKRSWIVVRVLVAIDPGLENSDGHENFMSCSLKTVN